MAINLTACLEYEESWNASNMKPFCGLEFAAFAAEPVNFTLVRR
jgi:hypothetical protein